MQGDSISFCVSSKHRQTQRFLNALESYLLEMQGLLKQLHQEANRKPNSVRLLLRLVAGSTRI